MTVSEVRRKYLEFFRKKGHVIVPSSPLMPENDSTTLFTGSGMQPMLPYLLGESHPLGKRIADSQKAFRAQDIEEVGDNRHTTFFEMLGNWSLGDYFKQEQLPWVFEFLVDEVGLDPRRLYFTTFSGCAEHGIPKDTESVEILKRLFDERGIEARDVEITTEKRGGEVGMQVGLQPNGSPVLGRIFAYDAKKNWWSRSGVPDTMPVGEPGGPDSEIFFDFHPEAGDRCIRAGFGTFCHPNCDCGRFMEIGNSVFMEYRKTDRGFEKLPQRNVDFGGGLERIAAAANPDADDVFMLDVFQPIIRELESASGRFYADESAKKSFRIVAEHLRAAVFLIADGASPSNTDQGYFTRRLIRRAVRHLDLLGIRLNTLGRLIAPIIAAYETSYPSLSARRSQMEEEIADEEQKFRRALDAGLKEFNRLAHPLGDSLEDQRKRKIRGADAFMLFSTHGLPIDMIEDLARESGLSVNIGEFQTELNKHHAVSRAGIEKKFKGGLADTTEKSVKYHTATHLLHQALRDVLGNDVQQKGSNITPERLRFDFSLGRKMTEDEKRKVEYVINDVISKKLPVNKTVLPLQEAEKTGALHFFGEKYGDEVSIYFIGDSLETAYSKEFCGGPHVENTGVLGTFKITKEEAVSAGVRRIKAILTDHR